MKALPPRFGLLSLHTTGQNTDAYLYQSLEEGVVRLNHQTIVPCSPELVRLEKAMALPSTGAELVQRLQQPLISLIQKLPLSGQDKTRLVAMLTAPKKTHSYIQRNAQNPSTQVCFSDRDSKN